MQLDRAWLTNVGTGEQLAFFTSGWQLKASQPGEVRRYAGGRLRAVSRAGQGRAAQLTARRLTRDQKDQLESWSGALLLLRNVHGVKLFGVSFDFAPVAYQDRSGWDVVFTVAEVSHSEAV